jgi:AraC-like DNA-binding protein
MGAQPRSALDPALRSTSLELLRVKRLGAEYRAATGMPLVLCDRNGTEQWRLGGCMLCQRLGRSSKLASCCREHRRRSIEESLRWGEPCIALCPFGLVTFAVPLSAEKRLSGGLISGFSIFPQMQPDMREEVLARIGKKGASPLGPRPRLHFRVVPSDALRRNAYLLFDLASACGLNDLEQIAEHRARNSQQFSIASYLEEARDGDRDLLTSLVSMQNTIIDRVVLGDLSGSREIINRFLGVIFLESGMSFDMLKVRLLELIVIISRAAMSKGISADGLLGQRYSYLTDINSATGFDDLFWKVTRALENFTRAISEERGRGAHLHVARMKEFLTRNFAVKVTAAEVAAAADLSVSRALHLFKAETGGTLWAYIARQRVDYARYLLRDTDRSMAEIGSECGFYDQSHFTRTFFALEGVTPLRYRRRLRGGAGAGPLTP